MKKRGLVAILIFLSMVGMVCGCSMDKANEVHTSKDDDLQEKETESEMQMQSDEKSENYTLLVNRNGEVEKLDVTQSNTGIVSDIEALVWLAQRSVSGDLITAEKNIYIEESNQCLNDNTEVGEHLWIRELRDKQETESGTTVSGHKDYLIYQEGEDAYVAIQSVENSDEWTLYQITGYGEWLQKEIDIFLRVMTGL